MIYLSTMLARRSHSGRKLRDLSFDPLDGEDHPCVQHVILDDGSAFAWEDFKQLTEPPRVQVPDHLVLLARDVLDGMILDLHNRRATRVNDIVLQEDGSKLRALSADVGLLALLRRLSRGWLSLPDFPSSQLSWKYVEFLRGEPEAALTAQRYRGRLTRLPAGDIAALAQSLPYLHAAELLLLLEPGTRASVFQILLPMRQRQVFEELPEATRSELLSLMSPDLSVVLLSQLGAKQAESLLPQVDSGPRERILKLLQYASQVAGGRMTNDLLCLPANTTIAEARARFASESPHFTPLVYVVGEGNQLVGTLSTPELFTAENADGTVQSLANPYINALPADRPAAAAAYEVLRSHLPALPVVGRDGELLGALTLDSAMDTVLPTSLGSQIPRVFT